MKSPRKAPKKDTASKFKGSGRKTSSRKTLVKKTYSPPSVEEEKELDVVMDVESESDLVLDEDIQVQTSVVIDPQPVEKVETP